MHPLYKLSKFCAGFLTLSWTFDTATTNESHFSKKFFETSPQGV